MTLKLCLQTLDTLEVDAIALGTCNDKRPLTGATSLLDWRLCGEFSQMLKNQIITGEEGETILFSPDNRISARRIFIFGLGDSKNLDAKIIPALKWMLAILERAKVESCSFMLPDVNSNLFESARALQFKELPFIYSGVFEQDPMYLA